MGDGGWSTWSDEEDDWDCGGATAPAAVGGLHLAAQLSRDPVLNQLGGVLQVVNESNAEAPPQDPDFGAQWHPPQRGRFKGSNRRGGGDDDNAAATDNDGAHGEETTPQQRQQQPQQPRRRYPAPRPPRRDSNLDVGLNRLRGGMENRVFVSSLPFRVFEDELEEFFAKFGAVKTCQVIRERAKRSQRRHHHDDVSYWSKGMGFVQFEDAEGMNAALTATPEQLRLDGRQINVAIARQMKGGRGMGDNGSGGGDGGDDANCREETEGNGDETEVSKKPEEHETDDKSLADATSALKLCTGAVDNTPEDEGEIHGSDAGSWFGRLPDHLLVKIFGFLPVREKVKSELVSKRWRRLARESWASLTEFILPDYPGAFAFRTLMDDRTFMRLLGRMSKHNLKKLDLSRSGLGFHALTRIGTSFPNLGVLDLSGTKVSLESLRGISGGCPKLRHFSLRESTDVKEKALWYILKDCRFLERLDIRGCTRITGNLFHLANDRLVAVNLERCLKFKDSSLAKLADNCTSLAELNLSNCSALTPQGIVKIASMPQLRSLTMRQMNFPSEASFSTAIRPEVLRDLDLSQNRSFGHDDLNLLYSRCSQLKRLNLSCCYSLNGTDFVCLCNRLPCLEYLNLSYVEFIITSIHAGTCFRALQEAVFVAIPHFDNDYLSYLLLFPNLKSLDISGNFAVTEDAFDAFADQRTKVENLMPVAGRDLVDLIDYIRRERPLKLKIGGTEITRAALEARDDIEPFYEINWFDSSIFTLRQDRHLMAFDDFYDEDDDDDDDYEDADSFGAGGDLDDFDLDPMEEFERNWMS